MAGPIGTLGTIPTLTVGGYVFTDITNLISLLGYTSAQNNSTLRKVNSSAGYQVGVGKTFKWIMLQCQHIDGNVLRLSVAHADNDVGISSNTGAINPVGPIHSGAASDVFRYTGVDLTMRDFPLFFNVPENKYCWVLDNNGGNATTAIYKGFGYEV